MYDFGAQSITDVDTFHAYANTIPGLAGVSSFDNYNSVNGGGVGAYPNTGAGAIPGVITISLPTTHTHIKVEYTQSYNSSGSTINLYIDTFENLNTSSVKSSITNFGSKIFEYSYNPGDYLKIEEPVGSEGILGKDLKITFSNSQTQYSIDFPEDTECDILIVGGGAAGGGNGQGGGGGSGALIYVQNKSLNGEYTINVGRGGIAEREQNVGDNGTDSTITKDSTQLYVSKGGGGGGTGSTSGSIAQEGGSGGGGAGDGDGGSIVSGNIIDGVAVTISGTNYDNSSYTGNVGVNSLNDTGCFGNVGGAEVSGGETEWGGGGGGAGSVGSPTEETANAFISGEGGSGKKYDITGAETYYAGGGGGGIRPGTAFEETGSITVTVGVGGNGGGGKGGGGRFGFPDSNGWNASQHTGSGGGGVGASAPSNFQGGHGGSGIVIIRYKYIKEPLLIQTINNEYRYISFPTITGTNPTLYTMNFPEETNVQLLLLSSGEVKAVVPFDVTAGNVAIEVGSSGSPSTFGAISTAEDNTSYTSFDSIITGESITYTDSVVVVRYKRTKTIVIQVPSYGFFNFNEEDGWNVSQPENTTYTAGTGIELGDDNVITCTVTELPTMTQPDSTMSFLLSPSKTLTPSRTYRNRHTRKMY